MKENEIRNQQALDRYLELVGKDCDVYFSSRKDFKRVDCPSCKSKNYLERFSKNGFVYVSCTECDTLYVINRPALEQLNRFYSASESSSFWVERFFKPFLEARRKKIFRPRAERLPRPICWRT